ncbi:unnamed protein product [Chrysoparadoxa australica]
MLNDPDVCTSDPSRFKTMLESKAFAPYNLRELLGSQFTLAWARQDGLQEPLLIPSKEGLGMTMPDKKTFSVRSVADIIGHDKPVAVIEVSTQSELSGWTLGNWADYYEKKAADRTPLNVISLEFSATPLRQHVWSPALVRQLDWIDIVWPPERKRIFDYPRVQYYCLMSIAGSYTDFHVDFGGTSVWYHIIKGQKVFLFVPPTKENLAKYEAWICSPDQSSSFFGDWVDKCYRVCIEEGQTLIIPAGWIHAVFTPVDSLVFGGNFLHALTIPLQLEVHAMEVRTHVAEKFQFPHFREMMFLGAASLVVRLRSEQQTGAAELPEEQRLCSFERAGVMPLAKRCEGWLRGAKDKIPARWTQAAVKVGYSSPQEMIQAMKELAGGERKEEKPTPAPAQAPQLMTTSGLKVTIKSPAALPPLPPPASAAAGAVGGSSLKIRIKRPAGPGEGGAPTGVAKKAKAAEVASPRIKLTLPKRDGAVGTSGKAGLSGQRAEPLTTKDLGLSDSDSGDEEQKPASGQGASGAARVVPAEPGARQTTPVRPKLPQAGASDAVPSPKVGKARGSRKASSSRGTSARAKKRDASGGYNDEDEWQEGASDYEEEDEELDCELDEEEEDLRRAEEEEELEFERQLAEEEEFDDDDDLLSDDDAAYGAYSAPKPKPKRKAAAPARSRSKKVQASAKARTAAAAAAAAPRGMPSQVMNSEALRQLGRFKRAPASKVKLAQPASKSGGKAGKAPARGGRAALLKKLRVG